MSSANSTQRFLSNFSLWTSSQLLLGLSFISALATAQQPPDPLQQHYEAAQTFQLTGDWERAESEYREVLARALQRLGNLQAAERNYAEASRLLEAAIEAQPAHAEAHVDLAIAYFQQGDRAKATAQLQAVLAREPHHARAKHLLGKIYFTQGNFEAAVEHLQGTLGLKPDFDAAYMLALAYLKLKKMPETMLLFDEMLVSMGSSPQLHILLGRAYRETGFYEQAISHFNKAIARDPRYPRAHYYLGLTHLLQGGTQRFPEAREQFEAELAINPDDYFSRFFLGIIHLSERNFPAAQAALEHAARLRSDDPDPYLYLGQVYLATDRPDPAVETLQKSVALTGDFRHNNYQVARAHYLLGQALLKLGKRTEAEAELTRSQELRAQAFRLDQQSQQQLSAQQPPLEQKLPALEKSREIVLEDEGEPSPIPPEQAQEMRALLAEILGNAYHNLGVIQAQRQQFAQAADYFEQAFRWKPDLENLDRNWGQASFRAQRYTEAIAPLERYLARQPEDARARQLLGLSYFMADDFSKTIEVLRPLLADPPNDPGLLYALGVALVHTGEVDAGAQIFSRLLEQNPHVPEIRLLLGQAYAQQNQQAQALSELARALELNPRVPQAHYYSGLILLRQGRLEDAAEHFRAELSLNPADSAAKYHLAYVLLLQQQIEDGIALLREVVGEKPEYAEAHYQLGKALLQQGEVKAAIQSLETAVRLDPERDYSQYQLSVAYRRDGRLEDAERALQAYQKLKERNRKRQQP